MPIKLPFQMRASALEPIPPVPAMRANAGSLPPL